MPKTIVKCKNNFGDFEIVNTRGGSSIFSREGGGLSPFLFGQQIDFPSSPKALKDPVLAKFSV